MLRRCANLLHDTFVLEWCNKSFEEHDALPYRKVILHNVQDIFPECFGSKLRVGDRGLSQW